MRDLRLIDLFIESNALSVSPDATEIAFPEPT